jgi:hypothetical protein
VAGPPRGAPVGSRRKQDWDARLEGIAGAARPAFKAIGTPAAVERAAAARAREEVDQTPPQGREPCLTSMEVKTSGGERRPPYDGSMRRRRRLRAFRLTTALVRLELVAPITASAQGRPWSRSPLTNHDAQLDFLRWKGYQSGSARSGRLRGCGCRPRLGALASSARATTTTVVASPTAKSRAEAAFQRLSWCKVYG